jgi:hypothetical protein
MIDIEKQCGQSYGVAQGNVLAACISGSSGGSGYVNLSRGHFMTCQCCVILDSRDLIISRVQVQKIDILINSYFIVMRFVYWYIR